jgi:hypothetical protein
LERAEVEAADKRNPEDGRLDVKRTPVCCRVNLLSIIGKVTRQFGLTFA